MQIVIQKETQEKVEQVCDLLGVKKQELVERALLLYLDNLNRYLELKQEIREWDALSDEALLNFEKSL